jgi:hypothetical protein
VFSATNDRNANVCFRVVHRRTWQQVVVHWERGGELVRRGFVWIPSAHAFRTRAGLPLRGDYVGRWTVRILSLDGVELASHKFEVKG